MTNARIRRSVFGSRTRLPRASTYSKCAPRLRRASPGSSASTWRIIETLALQSGRQMRNERLGSAVLLEPALDLGDFLVVVVVLIDRERGLCLGSRAPPRRAIGHERIRERQVSL